MYKYVIGAKGEDKDLYYAGKHYIPTGQFSRSVYQATQYSDSADVERTRDALMYKFPTFTFTIIRIHITIMEL